MTPSFGPARATTIRHHHANRIILVPRAESLNEPGLAQSGAAMKEARDEVRGMFGHMRQVAEPKLLERNLIDIFHINDRREREQATRQGYFRRLDGLAAYTVDFARPEQREEVLDSLDGLLGSRIGVIDDFALGLPPPLLADEPTASSDYRQEGRWPEASGIVAAHQGGVRGDGIAFGMLDTGVDADHCEFDGRTVNFRYLPLRFEQPHRDVRGFDVSGHGTHVAGIAAGRQFGVAPDVGLHVGSVIESETMLTSAARVLRGLNWLIQTFDTPELRGRPRIINLSLGFDRDLVSLELRRDIDSRFKNHIEGMRLILNQASVTGEAMIFAAIGNGGSKRAGYPALFDSVFGIGAVDFSGRVTDFSGGRLVKPGELGPDGMPLTAKPDFFGYGQAVRSCVHRDRDGASHYETLSGSSMASPYAAAIAALYLSRQPNLTAEELRGVLTETGLPVAGHPGRLVRYDPQAAAHIA